MDFGISRIGSWVARQLAVVGTLTRFAFQTLRALGTLPQPGRVMTYRVLLNQIRFTALHALPLVALTSSILSFLLISQAVRELGRIGATELMGTLMVVAVVRELGPLVTALVVAGRSGTAIASELATNRVFGEVRSLEAMGIDPFHYLVLPRFVGGIISVFALIVVFDVTALSTGWAAAAINGMQGDRYADLVLSALTARDVWLTIGKSLVFGVIIGLVPAQAGLAAVSTPTAIPIAASRAVVRATVGIFVTSAAFLVVSLM